MAGYATSPNGYPVINSGGADAAEYPAVAPAAAYPAPAPPPMQHFQPMSEDKPYQQQGLYQPYMHNPAPGAMMVPQQQGMMMMGPNGCAASDPACACSPGWILFGLGFLFTPLWWASWCVPCCTRKRSDKYAAMASGIAFAVCFLLIFFLVVLPYIRAAAIVTAAASYNYNYGSSPAP